jgi:hypothetical protein
MLSHNEKAVLFSRYVDVVGHMRTLFGNRGVYITGDIPCAERFRQIEKYRRSSTGKILTMTYGVGGESYNVPEAKSAFFVDFPWTYQEFMHAMDRIHRIGQNQPINVYRIIAKGTVDEHVLEVLKVSQRLHELMILGEEIMPITDEELLVEWIAREYEIPVPELRESHRFFKDLKDDPVVASAIADIKNPDNNRGQMPPIALPTSAPIHRTVRQRISLKPYQFATLRAMQNEGQEKYRILSGPEIRVLIDARKGLTADQLTQKYNQQWIDYFESAMVKLGAKNFDAIENLHELPAFFLPNNIGEWVEEEDDPVWRVILRRIKENQKLKAVPSAAPVSLDAAEEENRTKESLLTFLQSM